MGNLNKDQFVTLYRGMNVSPSEVNTRQLGRHWSTEKLVAEDFAVFDEEGNAGSGTVVTGSVHRRHLTSWRDAPDAFNPERHKEKEHPVRTGGIVHVRGAEAVDANGAYTPAELSLSKRRTARA